MIRNVRLSEICLVFGLFSNIIKSEMKKTFGEITLTHYEQDQVSQKGPDMQTHAQAVFNTQGKTQKGQNVLFFFLGDKNPEGRF